MQFVYPFVLIYDKDVDCFAIKFEDLPLYADGSTVEEAYLKAKGFLEAYCKCTAYLQNEFAPATNYKKVKDNNPNDIVLLTDYNLDEKKYGYSKNAFIVETE